MRKQLSQTSAHEDIETKALEDKTLKEKMHSLLKIDNIEVTDSYSFK